MANTLTRDFYIYHHLINQYTDNVKIEQYFNKLNNKAEYIKKDILIFVAYIAGNITKTVDLVKNETDTTWEIVKNQTNLVIYELLDETFQNKFNYLTNLNDFYSKNINRFQFNPLTVYVINSNREIINTIIININVINITAGCSLYRLGTYDFTMDVFTSGIIELNATTYVNNQII